MLDPTKLIPEELVPVRVVARLTLDRVVTNVFAETEQVAFMTQNIVPGIDFSDDPLLQGRNFSYLDTQLKRLGSTNFSQLPVNAPRCPVAHFQRDGHMQGTLQEGRANYEPNSFTGAERGPRADTAGGFATHPDGDVGPKRRIRAESFADHYSQAKLFWDSQTPVEQDHIVAAFAFELGKCELPRIRTAMLANLRNVDDDLATKVAEKLGMPLPDAALLEAVVAAFEKGGALVDLIGPSVGLEVGGRPMDHADAAALLEAAGLAEAVGSDGVLAVEESSVKAFWRPAAASGSGTVTSGPERADARVGGPGVVD